MTHKFKFGDRVSCENYPTTGVIVGLDETGDIATVCFVALYRPERVETKSLKLIPHPDTVRLDWLLKNDCALTERLCDEDGDILDTPNAVIQKQEDHFKVLAATSNDIREAIDEAMDSVGTR
ncbi:MAG: hypothetical protein D8H97_05835 [Neisseria sp.]|nr:MAG: hypothetical protein D8H97_05835 [Neisseria sp.]